MDTTFFGINTTSDSRRRTTPPTQGGDTGKCSTLDAEQHVYNMSVREARVAAVFGEGIFAFGSFVVQAVGRHLEHKLEDCPGEPVEAEPQQAVPAAASLDEEAKRIVDEIMQDHHHLHAAGRTDGSADAACGSDDCERTFSSFGGHGKISGRRKNYTFSEAGCGKARTADDRPYRPRPTRR